MILQTVAKMKTLTKHIEEKLIINKHFRDYVDIEHLMTRVHPSVTGTKLSNGVLTNDNPSSFLNEYIHTMLDGPCYKFNIIMPVNIVDEMRENMLKNINFENWWIFVCGSENDNSYLKINNFISYSIDIPLFFLSDT